MKWIIERIETRRQALVIEAADEADLAQQLGKADEADWQAQEPAVSFRAYPKGSAATAADVAQDLAQLKAVLKQVLAGIRDLAAQFTATESEKPAAD